MLMIEFDFLKSGTVIHMPGTSFSMVIKCAFLMSWYHVLRTLCTALFRVTSMMNICGAQKICVKNMCGSQQPNISEYSHQH